MFKLIGASIILVSCIIYGNNLSKHEADSLNTCESLITFIMFINTSIKTTRKPLNIIYKDFSNEILEKFGFTEILNRDGLYDATYSIENKLTKNVLEALVFLDNNLGGINIESQLRVCDYVEGILRDEYMKIKNNYKEKCRMYRLLPILAGLSLIILMV